MAVETITAGNAAAIRSSTAAEMNDCVPPPLAPVMPMRFLSTSGNVTSQSTMRNELNVCSPSTLSERDSACALNRPH